MKKLFIVAVVIMAFLLSSCASIFCGSKAKVTFDSNVNETAKLTIDGRKYSNVNFPYTTKIPRGFDETIVKAEIEGYETLVLYIDKKFNWVSIINLTDVIGWCIDAATGAITSPEYKYYTLEFVKEQSDKDEE